MDAGACVSCQNALGEYQPEQTIGYFPRLRCVQCGWVNVLTAEGFAVFAPSAESWSQPEQVESFAEPAADAPLAEIAAETEENEEVELAVSESVPFAMVAYQAENSWDDDSPEDSAETGYFKARKGAEEFLEENEEPKVESAAPMVQFEEGNDFAAEQDWEAATAVPTSDAASAEVVSPEQDSPEPEEKNEELHEDGLAEPRLTMMQELSDDDLAEIAALSAAAGFGGVPKQEEVEEVDPMEMQDSFTSTEAPLEELDALGFDEGAEATRVGIDLAQMEEEQAKKQS